MGTGGSGRWARGRRARSRGAGRALRLGGGEGSSERAPLDLPPVILQGAVEVYRRGLGGLVGSAVSKGAVDRLVFLDRGRGARTEAVVDADRTGLALQPTGVAHRAAEEGVVRGRGHRHV